MSLARNSRAVLAVARDSRRGFRPAHLRARRNPTSPVLARRRFSTTQLPLARCFAPRPGCGGDEARNTFTPAHGAMARPAWAKPWTTPARAARSPETGGRAPPSSTEGRSSSRHHLCTATRPRTTAAGLRDIGIKLRTGATHPRTATVSCPRRTPRPAPRAIRKPRHRRNGTSRAGQRTRCTQFSSRRRRPVPRTPSGLVRASIEARRRCTSCAIPSRSPRFLRRRRRTSAVDPPDDGGVALPRMIGDSSWREHPPTTAG